MDIRIDSSKISSIFEGFGASGAWWAQEVGGWTHIDEKSGIAVRDEISRLLYDKSYGIGLRTYRYNIGAGSAHSGNGNINMRMRRTESFDAGDGKYDFSRDENAVYMMKQAVKDGADEIILFVNSPIERLTKNGWSHLKKNQIMRDNLAVKNYSAFAKYCLDVTEHFVKEGLPVKYLSPINEPIWIWTGGQEGCHYSPWSAGRVMKCFADEMKNRPILRDVKLSGVESGDIRWFNKSFTRELMRYKSVRERIDSVDVHSYFLKFPIPLFSQFMDDRYAFLTRYRKWLDKHYPNLPVKMSEWCHMQGGRDKTMKSALIMANVMYEDISILNVTSWQHWIAVSEVDYCDGLIYINLEDKTYEMTKRYYVTGNFSKYIPFGSKRIEVSSDDNEVKLLAFDTGDDIVIIVINDTDKEKNISVPYSQDAKIIVTDKDNDLCQNEFISGKTKITPESVSTILIKKN